MNAHVLALESARTLHHCGKPDRAEVEGTIQTVIRWSDDDPYRQGLIETPARLTRALEEAFAGRTQEPVEILQKSFDEIASGSGLGWLTYPTAATSASASLAALSKLLQIQEKLTAQIAHKVCEVLKPRGVGVVQADPS